MRIVIATIVGLLGDLYPSTETKELMGASITDAFSCLKITRPGVSNYCPHYNKKKRVVSLTHYDPEGPRVLGCLYTHIQEYDPMGTRKIISIIVAGYSNVCYEDFSS